MGVAHESLLLTVISRNLFVRPPLLLAMTGRTATVPNMMIDGSVMESAANTANLIATSSADNGGAFFPVAGIVSLAALILYLAPPLKED